MKLIQVALLICPYHLDDEQNQWSNVFSGIVSKAITLEVLSTGVAGNYDGALQLVYIVASYTVSSHTLQLFQANKDETSDLEFSDDSGIPSTISSCSNPGDLVRPVLQTPS